MNFSLFFGIIIGVISIIKLSFGFQYARCYQKLERHSIDNSQPLTEIFRITPLECLSECITHTGNEQNNLGLCRSVVYDHLQHSCRLYSHDGREIPAIIHPANGFDLYRRTASSQECAGPLQRFKASLQAKKRVLAAPSITKESSIKPIEEPKEEEKVEKEEETTTIETIKINEEEEKEEKELLEEEELSSLLDQLDFTTNDEELIKSNNELLNCKFKGKPTGYFVFPDGQREDENSEEFPGWSQRECAQFCSENEGPDGLKYNCAGFSHVLGGGKCRLHKEIADKQIKFQQMDGGLYAEKWCIPVHRFGVCRDSSPFDIRLQQRFHSKCIPIRILDNIQNLAECMILCLNQSECHTISFHTPTGRCLLHREYLLPIFMEETDINWTLASNGCIEQKGKYIPLVDNEEGEMEKNIKKFPLFSSKIEQKRIEIIKNKELIKSTGCGEDVNLFKNLFNFAKQRKRLFN